MRTEVLVVGGGATGAGVARDCAMRGLATLLVERGPLASGTTARFHGQLHSGARYALADPVSARECVRESAILRRIAPACIEDTGGVFVLLPGDDPGYPGRFLPACRAAGVAVEELDPAGILEQEPALTRDVIRAFGVPDGTLDSVRLVRACAASATASGAHILTGRPVTGLRLEAGRVVGAILGDGTSLEAEVVVNAAGAWAAGLAAMAGGRVPARLSKGVMVAAGHRLVRAVVSRCRLPGDGDALVPLGGSTIIGTTDTPVTDPDDAVADDAAVEAMLAAGDELVGGFSSSGPLRAWAAVRPLVGDGAGGPASPSGGRQVSRSHRVIDHGEQDGVAGLITVTGGKATTFRLMAEEAVDAVCAFLGSPRPCRTAVEALPVEEGLDVAR
ncbi:MAG TPA: FAD-dependent oxidoreductase [Actinomycetota bacterium]